MIREFDDNHIAVDINVWNDMVGRLGEWFENTARSMKHFADTWFPAYQDIHRAEVKRIHMAYSRKQKARRRRKRK